MGSSGMYGQDRLDDCMRIIRAVLTNQLAHYLPSYYLRLTRQTGRGAGEESAHDVANYFQICLRDYSKILGIPENAEHQFLSGKHVLEYGPGDIPGIALLMIAHGAEQVICVDRFPMIKLSKRNQGVIENMIDGLEDEEKSHTQSCFNRIGDLASGFDERHIRYLVNSSGLSGLSNAVDMIVSRAVLEHVNDLSATFQDMYAALKPGGMAIHQVDLKSHGLHRSNPLDFLTWPSSIWSRMYSYKGVPNRWRVDRYREAVKDAGLQLLQLTPTALAEEHHVKEVRPYLAEPFRYLDDENLSWLGFWLVCQKRPSPDCEASSVADGFPATAPTS